MDETKIFAAFKEMLLEVRYDKINIKTLVENVNGNRSTFYYRYNTLDEFAVAFLNHEVFYEVNECLEKLEYKKAYEILLNYGYNNRIILRNLYQCIAGFDTIFATLIFGKIREIILTNLKEEALNLYNMPSYEFLNYYSYGLASEFVRGAKHMLYSNESPDIYVKFFQIYVEGIPACIKTAAEHNM